MSTEIPPPELTSEELIHAVESGEDIQILDVRAPHRLDSGRIDIVADRHFLNVRGSEILALEYAGAIGLDPEARVVVVCGFGSDSRRIARHLNEHGFDAASLAGGMIRWMETLVPRELAPPPALDRLVQFDRIGKGALGYLLVSDGEALVIDAPRHMEPFLAAAEASGARIVGVADTHAHADYISGGPALAEACGVPYYLHAADAVYPYDGTPGRVSHEGLAEGGSLRVGRAELAVVHTPGHTEGSLTYRLDEHLAFTGDFIFMASVGRPDLGGKTEEWTKVLWSSLARAKREWPGSVRVLPAHYASPSERGEDFSVGQPFSRLCLVNEPLAMDDERAFAQWVRGRTGPFPEAYKRIKAINLGLETVDDTEAEELEAGRNQCALG